MIAVGTDSGSATGTFFGGKAHEGGSIRKMDRDLQILEIGFMRPGGMKAENGAGQQTDPARTKKVVNQRFASSF